VAKLDKPHEKAPSDQFKKAPFATLKPFPDKKLWVLYVNPDLLFDHFISNRTHKKSPRLQVLDTGYLVSQTDSYLNWFQDKKLVNQG
jgi:hypothetical protein